MSDNQVMIDNAKHLLEHGTGTGKVGCHCCFAWEAFRGKRCCIKNEEGFEGCSTYSIRKKVRKFLEQKLKEMGEVE